MTGPAISPLAVKLDDLVFAVAQMYGGPGVYVSEPHKRRVRSILGELFETSCYVQSVVVNRPGEPTIGVDLGDPRGDVTARSVSRQVGPGVWHHEVIHTEDDFKRRHPTNAVYDDLKRQAQQDVMAKVGRLGSLADIASTPAGHLDAAARLEKIDRDLGALMHCLRTSTAFWGAEALEGKLTAIQSIARGK